VHDVAEIRRENQFVAEEMEKRGFQQQDYGSGLQWVGGVSLPGDPEDDRQLEAFLRSKYHEKVRREREATLGTGRTLGHRRD